jgi:hypothetical protein
VYLSGQEALLKLGLTKKDTSDLLIQLHLLAVDEAHAITLARRQLERGRPLATRHTDKIGVG